jgi:hypothetical protein
VRKRVYEAKIREPYMGNTVRVIMEIYETGEEKDERPRQIFVHIEGAPKMRAKEIKPKEEEIE